MSHEKGQEWKPTDSQIVDLCFEIVNDHSGGVKFTELVGELVPHIGPPDLDRVERLLRSMNGLKVLDYTWREFRRAKMFVYTP